MMKGLRRYVHHANIERVYRDAVAAGNSRLIIRALKCCARGTVIEGGGDGLKVVRSRSMSSRWYDQRHQYQATQERQDGPDVLLQLGSCLPS